MKPRASMNMVAIAAAVLASTSVLATPADDVRIRVAGLRELGAAFKNVNDGLRGGDIQTIMIQQAARQIVNASRAMPNWFPAGSGPQSGVRTAAKPDIWLRPAQFQTARAAFANEAVAFQRAAGSNNVDVIRAAARRLGGTCKSCHDSFRVPHQD